MREPDNLTGWLDWENRVWVRVDDCPGSRGTWWARTGDTIGTSFSWDEVDQNWEPQTPATPEATAAAIALVRRERS